MSRTRRGATLAPFRVRSFRFQWPADLATSWAFEMETLILGWYVLVETGSVVWLTAFASLQYMGTLIAPMVGVMGDRMGQRNMLCCMRGAYAVLAAALAALALTDSLDPVSVLVIAALHGLVRPSDVGMRNALIAASMPPRLLMGSMGVARTTSDSARVAGALAGAGLVAFLGMGPAYLAVTGFYVISLLLTLGVKPRRPRAPAVGLAAAGVTSPWRDLGNGFAYIWATPCLLAAMCLAFLVNLSAFPLTNGLLPFVAKEVYGIDRTGLGYLTASFSGGALLGSMLVGAIGSRVRPGRAMLVACTTWYLLLLVFARTDTATAGMVMLGLAGFAQSLNQVPMAVLLLRTSPESFRGRVMGVRMLAVYGLPLGLMIAGPLIERLGYATTATLYAGFGLACTLAIAVRWRGDLWPKALPVNAVRR